MFDRSRWQRIATALSACLIAGVMILTLLGCGDRFLKTTPKLNLVQPDSRNPSAVQRASNISEVSPPDTIQQLHQALEDRQPQITILTPQTNEILQDNSVNVRFQVQDLPIFKSELNLGPHLNVILDNEPYINIYNLDAPLTLPDLAPGTHTLRVFAAYPWEESFKNEGAYAQTTFHIFAKNQSNDPAPEKPLLTYNTPQGSYGAQPILLDFFLSNAPLHLVAQENQQDDIADWRIRCTVNGESFIIDRWQPLYLQGFSPGKNWVQLEFIDEQGNSVSNVFNNTIRVITYEPSIDDPLSRLISGQLSATQARGIVDPNVLQVDTTPDVRSEPEPEQSPPAESTRSDQPQSDFVPEPDESFNRLEPQNTPDDGDETLPTQTIPEEIEVPAVQTVPESQVEQSTPQPDALEPEQPLRLQKHKGGYFNRRRTTVKSPVLPTPPESVEPPSPPEQSEPEIMTPPVPIQETPETNLETAP